MGGTAKRGDGRNVEQGLGKQIDRELENLRQTIGRARMATAKMETTLSGTHTNSVREWSSVLPVGNSTIHKFLRLSRSHSDVGCFADAVYDPEGFLLNLGECTCVCEAHSCSTLNGMSRHVYECMTCKDARRVKIGSRLEPCTACHSTEEIERIRHMRDSSGIPWDWFIDYDLTKLEPASLARQGLDTWLRLARRHWLLVLSGGVGSGKTHGAVAVCRIMMQEGHTVFFTTVVELMQRLRESSSFESEVKLDTVLHAPLTCGCLVLDDLGAQRDTPFVQEQLFRIVNERMTRRQLTVVTTNSTPDSVDMHDRLWSRLFGPRESFVISTGATDYRGMR